MIVSINFQEINGWHRKSSKTDGKTERNCAWIPISFVVWLATLQTVEHLCVVRDFATSKHRCGWERTTFSELKYSVFKQLNHLLSSVGSWRIDTNVSSIGDECDFGLSVLPNRSFAKESWIFSSWNSQSCVHSQQNERLALIDGMKDKKKVWKTQGSWLSTYLLLIDLCIVLAVDIWDGNFDVVWLDGVSDLHRQSYSGTIEERKNI